MKNILLIFLLIVSSLLRSQNYKIFYHLDFVKDTLIHHHDKRNMVIWINNDDFIFCSDELLKTDSSYSYHKEKIYLSPDEIEFMVLKKRTAVHKYYFADMQLYRTNEKFQLDILI